MHSHLAKFNPSVAINALWCLLIALALLAFPIIARQARIQSGIAPHLAPATPAAQETPRSAPAALLVTQTESPATARH